MRPTFFVQRAGNNLATLSLILGMVTILTAALLHFFSYLFTGVVNNTTLNVFISIPVVIGIFSILFGMISLKQVVANNAFGRGKAYVGMAVGGVALVGLLIFLIYLFTKI